jgi:hypothetical protein
MKLTMEEFNEEVAVVQEKVARLLLEHHKEVGRDLNSWDANEERLRIECCVAGHIAGSAIGSLPLDTDRRRFADAVWKTTQGSAEVHFREYERLRLSMIERPVT